MCPSTTNRHSVHRSSPRLFLHVLEDRTVPATAFPDFFSTNINVPLSVAAPGVLANDTPDPLNPPSFLLSATLVSNVPLAAGSVVLQSDGSFKYLPAAGFTGDAVFQYRATDAISSSTTTATITVIGPAPVTQPDTYSTTVGVPLTIAAPGVLANDTDPSGAALTAGLQSAPPVAEGTVVLNPNGSFVFTPAAGFSGTTTFLYFASNNSNSHVDTVTITVSPATVPPVTVPPTTVPPVTVPPTVSPPTVVAPPTVVSPPTALPTVPPNVPNATRTSVKLTAASVGAGNAPAVSVYNADGSVRFTLVPFESSFTGGVRVAIADLTGDGVDDIIAGAGPGGAPRVVAFDGATGKTIADFFAYEESFRGGVHVAAGDVDGDGRAEYVLGAGSLGGPRVRVVRFDGTTIADYFAYDRGFRGGVRVAVGDLDGDGHAEVVTAPGPSGGPDVRIFDGQSGAIRSSFLALEPEYRGGLNVAVVSAGNGRTGSVVVAPESYPLFEGTGLQILASVLPNLDGSPSGAPISEATATTDAIVRVYNFASGLSGRPTPNATLRPYGTNYKDGVRVAGSDSTADGYDFAIAPATGSRNAVKFVRVSGSSIETVREFLPFDAGFNGSVFVGS